jgi:hypothetical protein
MEGESAHMTRPTYSGFFFGISTPSATASSSGSDV